jgi:hypothetical protein
MAATAAAHDWPASPVTTVNRPLPVRSSVAETRLPFRSTSHTWGIVVPVGCQKSAWPMSCGDVQGQAYGIMIIRVLAPALSHLRPALRLAGPARPVNGRQGCRAAGAAARGRRAAPRQSAAPAGLGRPRSPYRADPAPAASAADAPAGHQDSHQLVADDPSRPLTAAQLSKAREIIDIATVQSRYNLTDRSEQQMVDICEHEGMAFISWAPMAQGGLDQTAKPSLICASRVRAE